MALTGNAPALIRRPVVMARRTPMISRNRRTRGKKNDSNDVRSKVGGVKIDVSLEKIIRVKNLSARKRKIQSQFEM